MKTLSQLLKEVSWEGVKEALLKYYPEFERSIEGFKQAFYELRRIEPEENKEGWTLVVNHCKDYFTNEDVLDVYKINEKGEDFAISFIPWRKCVGYFVDETSLGLMTKEEYVCHILFELTYDGFDSKSVEERAKEFFKTLANALNEHYSENGGIVRWQCE